MVAEECRRLLARLKTDPPRTIALWEMEGTPTKRSPQARLRPSTVEQLSIRGVGRGGRTVTAPCCPPGRADRRVCDRFEAAGRPGSSPVEDYLDAEAGPEREALQNLRVDAHYRSPCTAPTLVRGVLCHPGRTVRRGRVLGELAAAAWVSSLQGKADPAESSCGPQDDSAGANVARGHGSVSP
jgi:hypothetical protein